MPTRVMEDEFLALLCGDEEVVRAEFDAIINANWEDPPPVPTPRAPVPRTPYRPVVDPYGSGGPHAVRWPRERSPPRRAPSR